MARCWSFYHSILSLLIVLSRQYTVKAWSNDERYTQQPLPINSGLWICCSLRTHSRPIPYTVCSCCLPFRWLKAEMTAITFDSERSSWALLLDGTCKKKKKTPSLTYLYSTWKGHQNSFKRVCLLDAILKMGKRQGHQINLPPLYIPTLLIIHSIQGGRDE